MAILNELLSKLYGIVADPEKKEVSEDPSMAYPVSSKAPASRNRLSQNALLDISRALVPEEKGTEADTIPTERYGSIFTWPHMFGGSKIPGVSVANAPGRSAYLTTAGPDEVPAPEEPVKRVRTVSQRTPDFAGDPSPVQDEKNPSIKPQNYSHVNSNSTPTLGGVADAIFTPFQSIGTAVRGFIGDKRDLLGAIGQGLMSDPRPTIGLAAGFEKYDQIKKENVTDVALRKLGVSEEEIKAARANPVVMKALMHKLYMNRGGNAKTPVNTNTSSTEDALRKAGVSEEDIAAARDNPEVMRALIKRVYGEKKKDENTVERKGAALPDRLYAEYKKRVEAEGGTPKSFDQWYGEEFPAKQKYVDPETGQVYFIGPNGEVTQIPLPKARANPAQDVPDNIPRLQIKPNTPAPEEPKTSKARASEAKARIDAARAEKLETQNREAKANAFGRMAGFVDKLDIGLSKVNELAKHPGTEGLLGQRGLVPTVLPGATYDAEQLRQSILSQLGLNALTELRQLSKTGGALGQVTEKEHELLQQELDSLKPGISRERFNAAVQRINGHIARIRALTIQMYKDTYGELPEQYQGQEASAHPELFAEGGASSSVSAQPSRSDVQPAQPSGRVRIIRKVQE